MTKEHRQNLAEGAKKKLNECKTNIKKIQNSHQKKVSEDELSDEVTNYLYIYLYIKTFMINMDITLICQ